MKRVMTKDNGIKALGAVGKGLQAAGGEVSAKRFGAAVLHAVTSATGTQGAVQEGFGVRHETLARQGEW
jgi:hypothetical protein